MSDEDLIRGLNKHLSFARKNLNLENKDYFILQKVITPDSTFKIYKEYEYTLWLVTPTKKCVVVSTKLSIRAEDIHDKEALSSINIEFAKCLFCFISSSIYKGILEEKYNTSMKWIYR